MSYLVDNLNLNQLYPPAFPMMSVLCLGFISLLCLMIIMLIVENNFTSKFSEVSKKIIFIFPSYIYKKKYIRSFSYTYSIMDCVYSCICFGGFFGTFRTQMMTF